MALFFLGRCAEPLCSSHFLRHGFLEKSSWFHRNGCQSSRTIPMAFMFHTLRQVESLCIPPSLSGTIRLTGQKIIRCGTKGMQKLTGPAKSYWVYQDLLVYLLILKLEHRPLQHVIKAHRQKNGHYKMNLMLWLVRPTGLGKPSGQWALAQSSSLICNKDSDGHAHWLVTWANASHNPPSKQNFMLHSCESFPFCFVSRLFVLGATSQQAGWKKYAHGMETIPTFFEGVTATPSSQLLVSWHSLFECRCLCSTICALGRCGNLCTKTE